MISHLENDQQHLRYDYFVDPILCCLHAKVSGAVLIWGEGTSDTCNAHALGSAIDMLNCSLSISR